jgi:hypothetical protein
MGMAITGDFNSAFFGGSLMAASGGFIGDALSAARPGP